MKAGDEDGTRPGIGTGRVTCDMPIEQRWASSLGATVCPSLIRARLVRATLSASAAVRARTTPL